MARDLEIITLENQRSDWDEVTLRFDDKGLLIERDAYAARRDLPFSVSTYIYNLRGRKIMERNVTYPKINPGIYHDISIGTLPDSTLQWSVYYYDDEDSLVEWTMVELNDSVPETDLIRAYKYDNKGRKIEEDDINCYSAKDYVAFNVDGREFTERETFKYDDHNRLVESDGYFENKDTSHPYYLTRHTGTMVGVKEMYVYSGLSETEDSTISLRVYRENDGSITTDGATGAAYMGRHLPENNVTVEYDGHGNVIRRKTNGRVVMNREIEYF